MAIIVPRGKAKKVFIVVTHATVTTDRKTKTQEKCEFVDRLKHKHEVEATLIIEYISEKIVKNRNKDGNYQDFIWYLHRHYPQQMNELAAEYKPTQAAPSAATEDIAAALTTE
jgi:hypothetical protein